MGFQSSRQDSEIRNTPFATHPSTGALQRHKADQLRPSLVKAYQAKENARADGFRMRLEKTWDALQGAMDKAQLAIRTHEDRTVEDRWQRRFETPPPCRF